MRNTLVGHIINRPKSVVNLHELGIAPALSYEVTHQVSEIKEGEDVSLAGRLLRRRTMGKSSFAELQDSSGNIQLYVTCDDICPEEDKTLYDTVFKKLLNNGDLIGVMGHAFINITGEMMVHVEELTVLSEECKHI